MIVKGMEFGRGDEEVALVMEEDGFDSFHFSSSSSSDSFHLSRMCQCRICHEEEEQSSSTMKSPCACSGTLKFAHRECIQRWCDEKGSTLCEICLQDFEPCYTVAPKKLVQVVGATIRGSLEAPRQDSELRNSGENEEAAVDSTECSPESRRSASCCRSVAVTFTIILLFRHLISVISLGSQHHVVTLFTVFALRACGILVPFYLIMRTISAIQKMQRQCHRDRHSIEETGDSLLQEDDDAQLEHHTIQIHS